MNVTLLSYTQLLPDLAGHVIARGAGTPQENLIEYAGRVCYRSDERMGHSPYFISARMQEGHEDIIEHVRLVFHVEQQPLDETVLELVNLPTVEFTRIGAMAQALDSLPVATVVQSFDAREWIFSLNARNIRDFYSRTGGPLATALMSLAFPVMPAVFEDLL